VDLKEEGDPGDSQTVIRTGQGSVEISAGRLRRCRKFDTSGLARGIAAYQLTSPFPAG
jgi:hypothetical protein